MDDDGVVGRGELIQQRQEIEGGLETLLVFRLMIFSRALIMVWVGAIMPLVESVNIRWIGRNRCFRMQNESSIFSENWMVIS